MLWPNGTTTRPRVSSPFGPRPNVGAFSFHYGADLTGYNTVHACGAGLVTFAGWMNPAAGNTVVIDYGGGVTEVHMHLASFTVRRGIRVVPGSKLGVMGDTGNATGNCDHLEIRVWGASVDPIPYISARLSALAGGTTAGEEPDMALNAATDYPAFAEMLQRALRYDVRPNGVGATWELGPTLWERLNQIQAAQKGVELDAADIAAIAAAIPDNIAQQVADELAARLAKGSA